MEISTLCVFGSFVAGIREDLVNIFCEMLAGINVRHGHFIPSRSGYMFLLLISQVPGSRKRYVILQSKID